MHTKTNKCTFYTYKSRIEQRYLEDLTRICMNDMSFVLQILLHNHLGMGVMLIVKNFIIVELGTEPSS